MRLIGAADGLAGNLFVFSFVVAVLNSVDELFLNALWLYAWLSGKLRPDDQIPGPERPVAIFVPLWREHAVAGDMLAHNLATIRYSNYRVFVGCYPNDPQTVRVVQDVAARRSNVHLGMCPHDGPTSKGDCLNWIYRAMQSYEETHRLCHEVIVVHDAEDIIHPDELTVAVRDPEDDFVQFPVLPLPTPVTAVTHGIYCDEFALSHTRDMAVRHAFGGFLPSAGVGTAFSRRAIETLAASNGGQLFDPACLTEDYDCGFHLHRLGMRQRFVFLRDLPDGPLATREFFPPNWRAALRQRGRWVTGIVFQGWEKNGWTWAQAYWLWRDRKGPLINLAGTLSTVLLVYGALSSLFRSSDIASWFRNGAVASLAVQAIHLSVRVGCVWRWYGTAMALTVWPRQFCADALNFCAAVAAVSTYASAKFGGKPLAWRKTAHAYPIDTASPATTRVQSPVLRALPRAVMARWNIVPFAVNNGELQVASRSELQADARADLRRFTSLRVRVHLASQTEYAALAAAASEPRPESAGAGN